MNSSVQSRLAKAVRPVEFQGSSRESPSQIKVKAISAKYSFQISCSQLLILHLTWLCLFFRLTLALPKDLMQKGFDLSLEGPNP